MRIYINLFLVESNIGKKNVAEAFQTAAGLCEALEEERCYSNSRIILFLASSLKSLKPSYDMLLNILNLSLFFQLVGLNTFTWQISSSQEHTCRHNAIKFSVLASSVIHVRVHCLYYKAAFQ